MAYLIYVDTCPRCGGVGVEVISETNTQYDRVLQQTDACRECGGEGHVTVEEEDDDNV